MEPNSKWQTKELTQIFLEGIRGAIPGADLQLAVIGKIADKKEHILAPAEDQSFDI